MKTILVCSILEGEVKKIMEDLNLCNRLKYIDAALHVDNDLMENALKSSLKEFEHSKEDPKEGPAVVIGTKCHPNIRKIVESYGSEIFNASNCVEMLLGDKMYELSEEAKTFFLTVGWLDNWRKIFIEGLKWDPIDARINFGCYERIHLLDAGLREISDEEIIEFFEYTEVPIDIYPITLDHFKQEFLKLVQ